MYCTLFIVAGMHLRFSFSRLLLLLSTRPLATEVHHTFDHLNTEYLQKVHAIDVAHCIFAISLSGGAAASLNLGQRKFQFDLGELFPGAVAADSQAASAAGAVSLAGSVTSQGCKQRSLADSASVNWRVSVGSQSARSQLSSPGPASGCGGGMKRGSSHGRVLDLGSQENTGSAKTFVSCKSECTTAGEANTPTDSAVMEQPGQVGVDLANGIPRSHSNSPDASYLDGQFWNALSINDGTELHDAMSGNGDHVESEEDVDGGILNWLGWV
jgi:hypothetical protein